MERTGESAIQGTFDVARVNASLSGTIFHGKLHHFTSVDSTQSLAIAVANAGEAAGHVYLADEQTSGRGRGGHTWHSEPDRGLYLTVLARPRLHADAALRLSFAAALAAQAAVQSVSGARIDLRWPNDLVTLGPGSRKLGGILTETAMLADGSLRYAAIGIGINLHQAEMPMELQPTSTSLLRLTGSRVSREQLAASLLRHLATELQSIEKSASELLRRFAQASTWVEGKRVNVAEEESYTGVTAGLTEAGLLRVRCQHGGVRVVRHGGVREAD